MKKFVLIIGLLLSCTSYANTYKMSPQEVKWVSGINGFINACVANKLLPNEMAFLYASTASKLLAISDIDRNVYSDYYVKGIEAAQRMIQTDAEEGCGELREKVLPGFIEDMEATYQSVSSNQVAKYVGILSLITQTLDSFNESMYQQNQNLMNINNNLYRHNQNLINGFSNSSLSQNRNKNFMVDFGGGLINCRQVNSGYVYCS